MFVNGIEHSLLSQMIINENREHDIKYYSNILVLYSVSFTLWHNDSS